jgi:hypothetical protein
MGTPTVKPDDQAKAAQAMEQSLVSRGAALMHMVLRDPETGAYPASVTSLYMALDGRDTGAEGLTAAQLTPIYEDALWVARRRAYLGQELINEYTSSGKQPPKGALLEALVKKRVVASYGDQNHEQIAQLYDASQQFRKDMTESAPGGNAWSSLTRSPVTQAHYFEEAVKGVAGAADDVGSTFQLNGPSERTKALAVFELLDADYARTYDQTGVFSGVNPGNITGAATPFALRSLLPKKLLPTKAYAPVSILSSTLVRRAMNADEFRSGTGPLRKGAGLGSDDFSTIRDVFQREDPTLQERIPEAAVSGWLNTYDDRYAAPAYAMHTAEYENQSSLFNPGGLERYPMLGQFIPGVSDVVQGKHGPLAQTATNLTFEYGAEGAFYNLMSKVKPLLKLKNAPKVVPTPFNIVNGIRGAAGINMLQWGAQSLGSGLFDPRTAKAYREDGILAAAGATGEYGVQHANEAGRAAAKRIMDQASHGDAADRLAAMGNAAIDVTTNPWAISHLTLAGWKNVGGWAGHATGMDSSYSDAMTAKRKSEKVLAGVQANLDAEVNRKLQVKQERADGVKRVEKNDESRSKITDRLQSRSSTPVTPLNGALAGGLVGAGLGAIYSLIEPEDEKDDSLGSRMLSRSLIGGSLGALAGGGYAAYAGRDSA